MKADTPLFEKYRPTIPADKQCNEDHQRRGENQRRDADDDIKQPFNRMSAIDYSEPNAAFEAHGKAHPQAP